MSALLPSSTLFEQHQIRRLYDDARETKILLGWFPVVDVIQVLLQQPDFQTARNYWKVLKLQAAERRMRGAGRGVHVRSGR